MVSESMTAEKKKEKYNSYPFWSPRFWHSMLVTDFLRLIARNRFRAHPIRWSMVILVTAVCAINSVLHLIERLIYGRRAAATRIEHAPIFILGHWRSGTTYLHEMLMKDERFATSTTYQVFAANHFLISSWLLSPLMRVLAPRYRPTDNIPFGMKRPQEDEFAQISMGQPTPYLTMAFPNHPPVYQEYLDMEGVAPEKITEWKACLLSFLKRITLRDPRRIVLKSPPHTARVKVLLEMFPDARFIHIVRDPYVIFPSTMRLWKSLYATQSLQMPRHEGLEEYVFSSLERMYASFEKNRSLVDPSRIVDVRYEDLIADPVGQIERVYESLSLEGFDAVRPKLEAEVAARSDYKTNRYVLSPELHEQISTRWAGYIEKYGYAQEPASM